MEAAAQKFLELKGMKFICANFTCRLGEIDLIMQHNETIVFVEVKYRQSSQFGGAISAISASKTKKITNSAQYYLQQQNLNAYNTSCRFDVVAIEGNIESPQITWLTNAF